MEAESKAIVTGGVAVFDRLKILISEQRKFVANWLPVATGNVEDGECILGNANGDEENNVSTLESLPGSDRLGLGATVEDLSKLSSSGSLHVTSTELLRNKLLPKETLKCKVKLGTTGHNQTCDFPRVKDIGEGAGLKGNDDENDDDEGRSSLLKSRKKINTKLGNIGVLVCQNEENAAAIEYSQRQLSGTNNLKGTNLVEHSSQSGSCGNAVVTKRQCSTSSYLDMLLAQRMAKRAKRSAKKTTVALTNGKDNTSGP